jgi:hypothetical protein
MYEVPCRAIARVQAGGLGEGSVTERSVVESKERTSCHTTGLVGQPFRATPGILLDFKSSPSKLGEEEEPHPLDNYS